MTQVLCCFDFAFDSLVLSRIEVQFQRHVITAWVACGIPSSGRLINNALSTSPYFGAENISLPEGGLDIWSVKRICYHRVHTPNRTVKQGGKRSRIHDICC